MNEFSLIYPMFALFLLTAVVLGTLLRTRLGLMREGQVSVGFFQIYRGEEPDRIPATRPRLARMLARCDGNRRAAGASRRRLRQLALLGRRQRLRAQL